MIVVFSHFLGYPESMLKACWAEKQPPNNPPWVYNAPCSTKEQQPLLQEQNRLSLLLLPQKASRLGCKREGGRKCRSCISQFSGILCSVVSNRRSGSALNPEDLGIASTQVWLWALRGWAERIYPWGWKGCKVSTGLAWADPCFSVSGKSPLFKKGKPSLSYSTQQQYQLIRCPCCSLRLFAPPMHLGISSPPDLYWKVYLLNMTTINTPKFNG